MCNSVHLFGDVEEHIKNSVVPLF